jgi:hypothetical protein
MVHPIEHPQAFKKARDAFDQYAGVSPSDEQLWRLVYLADLAHKAPPVDVTHGEAHRALARAVSTILDVLPELIAQAEPAAKAARQEGRTTDMDQFASRAKDLLAAAEPFRAIIPRRDIRGAWHGWAILMADEIEAILGDATGSITYRNAPIVQILMKLLGRSHGSVIEVLRKREANLLGNKK